MVWIGGRRSGKTYSIRHCLYEMKFKRLIAFAGSAECEDFYEGFVPKSFVYGDFNEAKLEEIIAYQHHLKNLRKRDPTIDLELAVVFDDFGFDDKVMKSKILKFLLQNGRNSGFFVGIALQYGINLPKSLRGNVDVVFIFDEHSRDNRQSLYKHYTSCFKTFDEFNEYLDIITAGGKCMVIDNTVKSNKLEDKIFWYQPLFDLPEPDFIAGDRGTIAFDRLHYRNELDELYGPNESAEISQSPIPDPSNGKKKRGNKLTKKELMMKSLFETPLACVGGVAGNNGHYMNNQEYHPMPAGSNTYNNNQYSPEGIYGDLYQRQQEQERYQDDSQIDEETQSPKYQSTKRKTTKAHDGTKSYPAWSMKSDKSIRLKPKREEKEVVIGKNQDQDYPRHYENQHQHHDQHSQQQHQYATSPETQYIPATTTMMYDQAQAGMGMDPYQIQQALQEWNTIMANSGLDPSAAEIMNQNHSAYLCQQQELFNVFQNQILEQQQQLLQYQQSVW